MGRKSNYQKTVEAANESKATSPAVPRIEDTPRFKEAVALAVEDATAAITDKILRRLQSVRGNSAEPAESADKAFAEGLAMAISQLTDQGVGRKKRVAPEVVRARAEAREHMMELIVEAKAAGNAPTYHLRNKVYLEETLIDPIYIDPASKGQKQTEIEWQSVPNQAMIPINDTAKGIYKAFLESIGGHPTKNYEQKGLAGVTAGGLVIRSGSKAVNPVTALNEKPPVHTESGLKIPHKSQPGRFVEKNILGTIAPPARQTI